MITQVKSRSVGHISCGSAVDRISLGPCRQGAWLLDMRGQRLDMLYICEYLLLSSCHGPVANSARIFVQKTGEKLHDSWMMLDDHPFEDRFISAATLAHHTQRHVKQSVSTLHQLLLPWLGCVVGATISPSPQSKASHLYSEYDMIIYDLDMI